MGSPIDSGFYVLMRQVVNDREEVYKVTGVDYEK